MSDIFLENDVKVLFLCLRQCILVAQISICYQYEVPNSTEIYNLQNCGIRCKIVLHKKCRTTIFISLNFSIPEFVQKLSL